VTLRWPWGGARRCPRCRVWCRKSSPPCSPPSSGWRRTCGPGATRSRKRAGAPRACSPTSPTELVGPHVGAEQLLLRLFSDEDPRVYEAQPVRFGCTCGPEKVVRSLAIYPASDIANMTTPEGKVTADCQFCGAHYEFDPSELGSG
jgi:hypothetical protein